MLHGLPSVLPKSFACCELGVKDGSMFTEPEGSTGELLENSERFLQIGLWTN